MDDVNRLRFYVVNNLDLNAIPGKCSQFSEIQTP